MVSQLSIKDLYVDQDFQARSTMNNDVISEYKFIVSTGKDLPPIKVVKTKERQIVVDGFHRINAYKSEGRDRIPAEIVEGDDRKALELAIGANCQHGLRRNSADKERAITMALNDFELCCRSDRELAELCQVSHPFVAKIREKLSKAPSNSKFKSNKSRNRKIEVEIFPPLNNVVTTDEEYDHDKHMINEILKENESLKDRLAISCMIATEEEKSLAKETIEELRSDNENLRMEIKSLKISRNTYQNENASLKKYINNLNYVIKKLNSQIAQLNSSKTKKSIEDVSG